MISKRVDEIIEKTKAIKISSEKVFDSGFIKIFNEKIKLPDGRVVVKQRISKNNDKDAAIIITRTNDDKYIIVFQNRVNGIVSAEFPSGYIEENEDVITGALREVKEETGFISDDAQIFDTSMSSIGTEDSIIHIVFVDNAVKVNDQDLDDDEYINYELFTFDELEELVNNNYIQGTSNKLAFYYLKNIVKK